MKGYDHSTELMYPHSPSWSTRLIFPFTAMHLDVTQAYPNMWDPFLLIDNIEDYIGFDKLMNYL